MEQELERLRKRNKELQNAIREGKEMEVLLRQQLMQAAERLRIAEEAEERLSVEMGELEVDSLEHARAYESHIEQLLDQLALAQKIMAASRNGATNGGDDM